MPLHILLTKCDKLKRGGQQNALLHVKKHVGDLATVQLFSSTHGVGQKILLHKLSGWLTAEDHNREMSDLSLAEPAEEVGDTIDS